MKANDIVKFKLDDSDNPGYAMVRILKPTHFVNGHQCWQVKVISTITPSQWRKLTTGAIVKSVSEGLLS